MMKSDQVLLCVIVISCQFCSVIKRNELLPSVIWNRDSYSPDGATVVHN